MSRTGTLALALLVALIGVVAALVYTSRGESGASDSAAATAATPLQPAPPASTSSNAALADAPVPAKAAVAPAPALPARSTVTVEDADPELATAIWIEGRVLFPEGTPLDEEAFVVGRGRTFEQRGMHEAVVQRDGSFRVAFAPRTRSFRFELLARYLYLGKDKEVDADDIDIPIVLEPRLGGVLEVLVISADGSAAAADELRGATVSVLNRDSGAQTRQRGGADEADGVWRFRGLPTDSSYDVSLTPNRLAHAFLEDVRVVPGETQRVEIVAHWGAIVRGRVLDEEGRPVEGARVSSHTDDGQWHETQRSAVTRPDGIFELVGVSAGSLSLNAFRSDFLPSNVEPGAIAEGQELAGLTLVMRRGGILAGTVRWPDGRPAAGANVQLEQKERFDPSELMTLPLFWASDRVVESDGRFEFSALPFGRYSIEVSAYEAAPPAAAKPSDAASSSAKSNSRVRGPKWSTRVESVETGTEGLVLVLARNLAIAGRVVDDTGAPIDRFGIRAERVDGGETDGRTFRTPSGSFRLEGLRAGAWRVSAHSQGEPCSAETVVTLPRDVADIVLVVPRAASVSGKVVDPDGAPVRRVLVRAELEHFGDPFTRTGSGSQDRTDSNGAFLLRGVAPGRTSIGAIGASGHGASDVKLLELRPGEARAGLVLSLRPTGRLEIELASGIADRAGREVSVRSVVGDRFSETYVTDASGLVSIDGLDATRYSIVLQEWTDAEGDSRSRLHTTARVTPAQTTRVVLDAPIAHPISVSGRVTRAGRPLHDAVVQFSIGDTCAESVHTDDHGRFALTLSGPGRYDALVATEEFELQKTVVVPDVREFTFDQDLATGRVAGRVIGADGAPVANVCVELVRLAAGVAERGEESARRRSDDLGRFEFPIVAPGRYVAMATGWLEHAGRPRRGTGFDPSPIPMASGEFEVDGEIPVEGVEIRLPAFGSLLAVVRDAHGLPAAGASVELLSPSDHVLSNAWEETSRLTNASGAVLFDRIAIGTARVHARLGERKSTIVSVNVVAGEVVQASLVLAD